MCPRHVPRAAQCRWFCPIYRRRRCCRVLFLRRRRIVYKMRNRRSPPDNIITRTCGGKWTSLRTRPRLCARLCVRACACVCAFTGARSEQQLNRRREQVQTNGPNISGVGYRCSAATSLVRTRRENERKINRYAFCARPVANLNERDSASWALWDNCSTVCSVTYNTRVPIAVFKWWRYGRWFWWLNRTSNFVWKK